MGVDAEMRVMTPDPIEEDDIMQLSVAAADAFGRGFFWIDRERRQPAIQRWEPREWEEVPMEGHWLKVNLSGRYYGEAYERGPITEYIALADWFEHRIPGCKVYYGGDNVEWLEPFTPERRQAYFRHWAENGHAPYRMARSSLNKEPIPECDWCHTPMRATIYHAMEATTYKCIHCEHEVKVPRQGVAAL